MLTPASVKVSSQHRIALSNSKAEIKTMKHSLAPLLSVGTDTGYRPGARFLEGRLGVGGLEGGGLWVWAPS